MAAMSHYLEDAVLNCIFRNISFTPPQIYIALLTTNADDADTGTTISTGTGTGIEVSTSGTGYERLLVSDWGAPDNGTTSNSTVISFPLATADWGEITGVAICDDPSAGNVLFHGFLSTPKPVFDGDTFEFALNDFVVSLG
jgi:hypothetical protein